MDYSFHWIQQNGGICSEEVRSLLRRSFLFCFVGWVSFPAGWNGSLRASANHACSDGAAVWGMLYVACLAVIAAGKIRCKSAASRRR